jgi:hypothetical protein
MKAMEHSEKQVMPAENFAVLGGGKIAYVRALKSDEAKSIFPGLPPVAPGLDLWALVAADGTPIMLADTREAVVMNAHEHDLETVSIH